ncbi:MAG: putative metal-binding motif-containing protein [Thermodesulfobacteriota bacterium]
MRQHATFASLLVAAVASGFLAAEAGAVSSYFTGNCLPCHSDDSASCAGCHYHGVRASGGASRLNLTATTDKTSYAPGEAMVVAVTGGYRPGWVRVLLYDEAGNRVATSSGPCDNPSLPDAGCGNGDAFPGPVRLTAAAPAAPGTYTYAASWYGNDFDRSSGFFGPDWTPDPNNPGHGEEIVATNAFTVVAPAVCTDQDGDGFAAEGGDCGPADCNDNSAAAYPGAVETCTDGLDNDCNGLIDAADPAAAGCPPICTDQDGDGFAAEGGDCGPADCNDNSAAVYPGAVETCTDGLDNDCNGLIDAADPAAIGCPAGCTDQDGDGFAADGGDCGPVDCDDASPAVFPGAGEACTDGFDNDCNGLADTADPACRPTVLTDYVIEKFRCTSYAIVDPRKGGDHRRGRSSEERQDRAPIKLRVSIQNQGDTDPGAVLKMSGTQGEVAIPVTPADGVQVFDEPGKGRKTLQFTYTPTRAGVITWQALLEDGDADEDQASCQSVVLPKRFVEEKWEEERQRSRQ